MSELTQADLDYDLETPGAIERRFDIEIVDLDSGDATAVMSIPIAGHRNPFTGMPTVGALAILVDAVGGMVNHFRRPPDRWTVSSELSVELSPDGAIQHTDSASPVIAAARPLGPVGASALSLCTLTSGETVIGAGTVRSFYISTNSITTQWPPDSLRKTARTPLSDLMAVETLSNEDGTRVLRQRVDPILNNAIGIVNGGVVAAGLELAASAAINPEPDGYPLRTASVRVNFLRPFFAGQDSRYMGAPLRIGRRTAVADAQAVGDDGRVAVTARVTAYR
jgi:uncharacterized protein (TIGR00369 family)